MNNDKWKSRVISISLLALAGLATWVIAGCATPPPTTAGVPTIMIALRVPGGAKPSAEQVAKIHRAVAAAVAEAGLQFAHRLDAADYVLNATFTPEPGDPNQGHLAINGIERNRRSHVRQPDPTAKKFEEMHAQLRALRSWAESRSAPVQNEVSP